MSSFTDRKTLMSCIEQLEEKVMVDQQYRSSERGKAGMFWLQQVLLDFFFLGKKIAMTTSWATTARRIQS